MTLTFRFEAWSPAATLPASVCRISSRECRDGCLRKGREAGAGPRDGPWPRDHGNQAVHR